jgi:hypothetical protein
MIRDNPIINAMDECLVLANKTLTCTPQVVQRECMSCDGPQAQNGRSSSCSNSYIDRSMDMPE